MVSLEWSLNWVRHVFVASAKISLKEVACMVVFHLRDGNESVCD